MAGKKVIFLCVENSCRSQMAEAFARIHGRDAVEAASAGSQPSGHVHPRAIQFMAEIGYDLTQHRSKGVDELAADEFDVAVAMGCGDACPNLRARERLDWQIRDPKDLPAEEFRRVRDQIETQVRTLIERLAY